MTDDTNLTPGGEMNDAPSVTVEFRSDADRHWIAGTKKQVKGTLGPNQDAVMAENVRAAKELELTHNDKSIDQARA